VNDWDADGRKIGWGYLICGTFVSPMGDSRPFQGAQWTPCQVGPEQLEKSAREYLKDQYPSADLSQVEILGFCWSEIGPVKDMS
jgi:hypothetical protein